MTRYYCPFCPSSYQFYKTKSDGSMICGLCGDPLIKKPLINSIQIVGLVAVSAFLTPLLIMVFFVVNDFSNKKPPENSLSSLPLTIK